MVLKYPIKINILRVSHEISIDTAATNDYNSLISGNFQIITNLIVK